jgi:hypothetical protein
LVSGSGIDHDALQGFVANEHIDWTADAGASNIHQNNVPNADDSDALGGVAAANYARLDTAQEFSKSKGSVVATPSSSSGTLTLDLESSNIFAVTTTENISTVTLTNKSSVAGAYTIIFKQTASHTVGGWDAKVLWPAGTAPTITTGAGAFDVITLIVDNGADPDIWGVFSQAFA